MKFNVVVIALCAAAGAVVGSIELRGVKELHKGVEAGDKSPARTETILQGNSVASRRAKTRAKCSGRGRVVTVTNFHTVTASLQQDISSHSVLATTSSNVAERENTSFSTSSVSTSSVSTSSVSTSSVSTSSNSTGPVAASSVSASSTSASSVFIGSVSTSSASTSSPSEASTSIDSNSVSPASTHPEVASTAKTNSTTASTAITSSTSSTISNTLSSATLSESTAAIAGSSTSEGTSKTLSTSINTTTAPSATSSSSPTGAVPVSRAGGTLDPTAAAEAHEFDKTATRPLESVNIKAADGRCLSIDPTAGDFRQNLIPVALVECSEDANQKFDIVTKGKHNDGKAGEALLVSVLTNGCISFDGRRQVGDTVTLFSCGGRAAGDGKTDGAQLYPFDGTDSIVLSPASGSNETCLVAGIERLESTDCTKSDDQVFQLVEVL